MKRFVSVVFLSVASVIALFSQRHITIPLDEHKEAVVCVNYEGVYNGKMPQGYILIHDTDSKKELLKIDVEMFIDDEYLSIVEDTLAVDEQVWVLYDDFNFDGIDDIALINGQLNYDDTYQYQVYLGTKDGRFVFNPDFTYIMSQGGTLIVDAKRKELRLEYEDDETNDVLVDIYKVKANKPELINSK